MTDIRRSAPDTYRMVHDNVYKPLPYPRLGPMDNPLLFLLLLPRRGPFHHFGGNTVRGWYDCSGGVLKRGPWLLVVVLVAVLVRAD